MIFTTDVVSSKGVVIIRPKSIMVIKINTATLVQKLTELRITAMELHNSNLGRPPESRKNLISFDGHIVPVELLLDLVVRLKFLGIVYRKIRIV